VPALPTPPAVAVAVAGALLTLTLANLAQLPAMERHEELGFRAFLRQPTADMAELGLEYSPTTRRHRSLYLELNLRAPGVDVVLGPGTELDPMELYGLARVREVVEVDYDPSELVPDLDVSDQVVVRSDDADERGPVPFTIALADDDPRTLVVRLVGARHDLIDIRLLPEVDVAELGR
jgi:hypothetical protein